MPIVDLSVLTKGEVSSLSGQPRGLQARAHYRLDELDNLAEQVVVHAPDNLDALTPSFVQGLFATSVHRLGRERFFNHYKFDVSPEIRSDIEVGVERALMRRHIAGAA